MHDGRFHRRLYTVAVAARYVGMHPSTLSTWAHGYERRPAGATHREAGTCRHRARTRRGRPENHPVHRARRGCPVVQAFRRAGLPMQRIRRALETLIAEGELEHALASRQLFSDGANVLYDYAASENDRQLRLLTVVVSGQRVFHEVVQEYLTRITFGRRLATELILPVTKRPLLRVIPGVAGGDPLFMREAAPLSARALAGGGGGTHRIDRRGLRDPRRRRRRALRAFQPTTRAA